MTGVTFYISTFLTQRKEKKKCELPLWEIFPLHQQFQFFEPNKSFFDRIAEY